MDSPRPEASPSTPRILVVDDERPLAQMVGSYLIRAGYAVTEAYTGPDAVSLARELDPHAIVLDLSRGECRNVLYTTDDLDLDDANFVIEANYAQWSAIIRRELDPILAMLTSQLKLSKGHLPTLIKDVESSKQLVLSAAQVDTQFLT